jgi:hypothetical protein
MAQPRRRPAETQTPQLTEDQVRTRAQNAFDASLNSVIRSQFSARPSAQEMAALRPFFERNQSVETAVNQYIQSLRTRDEESRNNNRPATAESSSVIARYFAFTGSAGWLLTPTGTLGFNQTQLAADVRTVLGNVRQQVATSFVDLYNQSRSENPSFTFVDTQLNALGAVGAGLLSGLVQQTNSGANSVPTFIASESDNIAGAFRIALRQSTQRHG